MLRNYSAVAHHDHTLHIDKEKFKKKNRNDENKPLIVMEYERHFS